MKIVTFDDIDEKFTAGFEVCFAHSGCGNDHDVAILDINSIFDYEEKKLSFCKENFISIAIIADPSDFEAFKNFGINAWIRRENLNELPALLNEVKKRLSS